MKTMAAGEFKAKCLQVTDQVSKWVPGRLAGKIEILGDIVSPVVPWEDW